MYDVFISYRRDGGHEMARLLYEHLKLKGLNCFFDLQELGSGQFNVKLLQSIDESKNFVLVLSPHSLERCENTDDWVRQEIEHAIAANKNIVPFMMDNFRWPTSLPESIARLPYYNGVQLVREYFDASIKKLLDLLVLDQPSANAEAAKETTPIAAVATPASLLKRALMFLEECDFTSAAEYCERVLDINPEEARAYLYLLLSKRGCRTEKDLIDITYFLK